ncbi:LysR family transcriptional regulator [Curvibacter gracilis]|uniref:LysR family transcriptional regulator n=1 Tax=Curvibacter gracilis TaxID=230310 RepID=UPI00146FAC0E|nr:LysR family transcriptional regulator [Curvibacter gracilis]
MAVFVATVETGSMAAAARALELQPALIGQQIQSLEEQLGTPLFERHGRWQRLTAAGAAYHQQCRSILEMVRGAEAGLQATTQQASGCLRVHAPVLFGTRELAPALAAFLQAYPKVQLSLVLDDRAANPVDDDFDLVFHRGEPLDHPGIECLPLCEEALTMVASAAYLERQGSPQRAEELVRHQCLGFMAPDELNEDERDDGAWSEEADCEADCEADHEDEDWEGPCGGRDECFGAEEGADAEAPLAPRVVVQANNALALHALALHGAGIAVLPRALVADDLAAGRLVALLPGLSLGVEPLGLLLRSDEAESPALAALVDWALERFRPQTAAATLAAPAAPAAPAVPEAPAVAALAEPEPVALPQPVAGEAGCAPVCQCQAADAVLA